jgi:primosomal protein N' (replication factor Y) (superfamily II helicase)
MASAGRVCRVLLDSALPQLDHLFDYRVPEGLADDAKPGVRVRVPLRSAGRVADGYLIEFADEDGFDGKLSDIEAVVSPVPVLTADVWALARLVADRSAGSANDVVRLAVPSRQVRVENAWLALRVAEREADRESDPANSRAASVAEPAAAVVPTAPILGYESGRLESVIDHNERAAVQAIPRLAALPGGEWVGEWALTLARAAVHCWSKGRSAIVVVPDYRDQIQLAAALSAIAPADAIAALDARQSNPDRYRAFLSCLAAPRIIIGNRSAIYAPAENLGLIALWDDGDPLHSEPLSPYVHARDAALIRQQRQGCALMFMGHTRTVEVQRLVELGWLQDALPTPAIVPKIIPTANQFESGLSASASRIPSTAWQQARKALDRGPVLVQVARPGYAPMLACRNCSKAARCNKCEGPLGLSSSTAIPSCAWCGSIASSWVCEHCQHTTLRSGSIGAGRTAEDLGKAFPGVRVILADGEHPIVSVDARPALVVATRGAEPIAAGGYQAVLLLDGERMLSRETLRVADDCLRWWSNAVALAAPGRATVLVGVGGFLAQTLVTWQHSAYAHRELADRRELSLPPASRLVSVTGTPDAVGSAVESLDPESFHDVLGPAPASDGLVRSIVRFGYADGPAVASQLRAAVIRNATTRRRVPTGKGGYARTPTLKVRFDDPEIL